MPCAALRSFRAGGRIVGDVRQFAALTTASLGVLDDGVRVRSLGGRGRAVRSRDASDRTSDIVRRTVVIALGLVAYESMAIARAELGRQCAQRGVPALHSRSSVVYGAVMVLGLTALIMAAVRTDPA